MKIARQKNHLVGQISTDVWTLLKNGALAEKWETTVKRIELRTQNKNDPGGPHGSNSRSSVDQNPDKIHIDELQKFKNRLTVHYSRRTHENVPSSSNIDAVFFGGFVILYKI